MTDAPAASPTTRAVGDAPIATLTAGKSTSVDIARRAVVGEASALADLMGGRPGLVVLSPSIERLYGNRLREQVAGLDVHVDVLPTGEVNKTPHSVERLLGVALDVGLSRDALVVGVGGGVLLDIVGFAASQYRRGIAHAKVGTTLVAQVDAAVGLKCGVNIGDAKNLAGSFYAPERVFTDGAFLRTVSVRDIRCGLAEMIKMGLGVDAELFDGLVRDGESLLDPDGRDADAGRALIDRSIRAMVAELTANPYETELRRRVDLGHTVSPILEAATRFDLAHGEAVAVDLALFAIVSRRLGGLSPDELDALFDLFARLGIQVWHPLLDDDAVILHALRSAEAHRGRRLHLPLPSGIGDTWFLDDRAALPTTLLRESVDELRRRSR